MFENEVAQVPILTMVENGVGQNFAPALKIAAEHKKWHWRRTGANFI